MQILAVMTRGLESIGAEELGTLPGVAVAEVAYRRVVAAYGGDPAALLTLRTVDDILLLLDTRSGFGHTDEALPEIEAWVTAQDYGAALAVRRQISDLPPAPGFDVTAGAVGRHNYTLAEIKAAVAAGVEAVTGWAYTGDDRSADLNVRIIMEHDVARLGLRLGAAPLHRRPYKTAQLPGSTKPTVAAAMARLAGAAPGVAVLDPCCGAGTILIEAALLGAGVRGGDNDPAAIAATRANARGAGVNARVQRWDARHLPLAAGTCPAIAANLPWGRQVETRTPLEPLYAALGAEFARVLAPGGRAVLLTSAPELLTLPGCALIQSLEISLFGQKPTIAVYRRPSDAPLTV